MMHDLHLLLVSFVLTALYTFAFRLSAIDMDAYKRDFLHAIKVAMVDAKLKHEEAARLISVHPNNLYKMLDGQKGYKLPFVEMVLHWPEDFWYEFNATLMQFVVKKHMAETRENVHRLIAQARDDIQRLTRRA
jgi:hypothetical protein